MLSMGYAVAEELLRPRDGAGSICKGQEPAPIDVERPSLENRNVEKERKRNVQIRNRENAAPRGSK